MTALTAPQMICLPEMDARPFGQDLFITDESGVCFGALTIASRPGPGTSDVIGAPNGAIVLLTPDLAVCFRCAAANLWIRL